MNWLLEKLLLISVAHGQADPNPPTADPNPSNLFTNPLKVDTLPELFNSLADFLLVIGVPIVTLMVLVGAFQIMTAAGNPEGLKTGKNTIVYAAIGFAILLVSKGVAALIANILGGTA